jgi:ABC-type glutathione transport system ATPase component
MKVELVNLTKRWGDVVGAEGINLATRDGEFVAFLGPSGCGKTTTLLMVAGIYKPTAGEILFDDKVVNTVPPKDRNIGMVFQSYALYPHMNVFQNIGYPLKLQKVPKEEMQKRARENPRKLVLPEGTEARTIQAARILVDEKLAASVTLLGEEEKIREEAEKQKVNLDGIELINPSKSDLIEQFAAEYYELRKHHRGVAKHSYHILGKAADIRIPKLPLRLLRRIAMHLGKGGVGYYPHSGFVHIDVGPVRYWRG